MRGTRLLLRHLSRKLEAASLSPAAVLQGPLEGIAPQVALGILLGPICQEGCRRGFSVLGPVRGARVPPTGDDPTAEVKQQAPATDSGGGSQGPRILDEHFKAALGRLRTMSEGGGRTSRDLKEGGQNAPHDMSGLADSLPSGGPPHLIDTPSSTPSHGPPANASVTPMNDPSASATGFGASSRAWGSLPPAGGGITSSEYTGISTDMDARAVSGPAAPQQVNRITGGVAGGIVDGDGGSVGGAVGGAAGGVGGAGRQGEASGSGAGQAGDGWEADGEAEDGGVEDDIDWDGVLLGEDLEGISGLPPLKEEPEVNWELEDRLRKKRRNLEKLKQAAKRWVRRVDEYGRSHGVGRRKTSVARAYLSEGTGVVVINSHALGEYFSDMSHRQEVLAPFFVTETEGRFDVVCRVAGGGIHGQSQAVSLAISRALKWFDPVYRRPLKQAKLLTRDNRMVERKKPGRAKARKGFQWVKR